MKHTVPSRLRVRLTTRYTHLRSRLTQLLGSADGATAALNETWLRLDQVPDSGTVADPDAYLLRIASNIARNQYRQDAPYLSADDVGQLVNYADELADTERVVASRRAGQRLLAVLDQLPVRQRAMLVAAHLHGERNETIARRLAFVGFAAAAVGLALAAAFSIPANTRTVTKSADGVPSLNGVLWRLIFATFLMGFASTAIWSFGGQLVTVRLSWSSAGAGFLWIAIGAAGIAGAGAGALIARFGIDRVHRIFLVIMAVGTLMVGVGGTTATLTIGGGIFSAQPTSCSLVSIWSGESRHCRIDPQQV